MAARTLTRNAVLREISSKDESSMQIEKWDKEFLNDYTLMMQATEVDGAGDRLYNNAPSNFQKNENFVIACIRSFFRSNKRFDEDAMTCFRNKLIKRFYNNKNIACEIAKVCSMWLTKFSDEVRDTKSVVITALRTDTWLYEYSMMEHNSTSGKKDGISDRLLFDRDVVKTAASTTPRILGYVPKFYDDEEIVLAAVEKSGYTLEFASERLRDKESVVLTALKDSGEALRYASTRIRAMLNIAKYAIEKSPYAYCYVDKSLKDDPEIVAKTLIRNGYLLKDMPDNIRDNRDFVLLAVETTSMALQFASKKLRDDDGVVFVAVKHYGEAFQYASERLRSSKPLLLLAVDSYASQIQFASDELKNDEDIALHIIEKHGGLTLQFMTLQMRSNKKVIEAAITKNKNAIEYVPKSMYEEAKKIYTNLYMR